MRETDIATTSVPTGHGQGHSMSFKGRNTCRSSPMKRSTPPTTRTLTMTIPVRLAVSLSPCLEMVVPEENTFQAMFTTNHLALALFTTSNLGGEPRLSRGTLLSCQLGSRRASRQLWDLGLAHRAGTRQWPYCKVGKGHTPSHREGPWWDCLG